MKSTIRVDFQGLEGAIEKSFEPVIKVNLEESEDVRDSLLKTFFQGANYLNVKYFQHDALKANSRIILTPVSSIETDGKLPSRFQIGDEVDFVTSENVDKAYELAKKKNPEIPENEVEFIPDYSWGKITSIKFTEAKVWYSVLDDYTGKIYEELDSCWVKSLAPEFSKNPNK